MFKLVVLSALLAVALAKPGLYHETVEVAAPIIANTYISPAAVSSTYREDIISKPASVAYAAVHVAAEPVAVAPVVAKTIVAPAAVSHTYREDIINKPGAVAYTAPAVVATPVVQEAYVHAYVAPAAVSSSYRSDLVSSPVVAKTVVPVAYGYAPAVHAW